MQGLGTFVYRDRKPPDGTEIPDLATAKRHQRIAATALEMQEGDNMAVGLEDLSPDMIYLTKPGEFHGASSALVANAPEPLFDIGPILADIDSLNAMGMSPGDLPAKAISYSFWHQVRPEPEPEKREWAALYDEIHGGWKWLDRGDINEMLQMRARPELTIRQAYARKLHALVSELTTKKALAEDA